MRINVYAEELTNEVEIIRKSPDNHPGVSFVGVRTYLASPELLHRDPDDDDRSAITVWVPWTMKSGHKPKIVIDLLRKMADDLEDEFS